MLELGPAISSADDLPGGFGDAVSGNPSRFHELVWCPGARKALDGQVANTGRVAGVAQGFEHGASHSTFRVVVFDDDEAVCGSGRGGQEGAGVNGLHGVQVNDAGSDPITGQLVSGGETVVQGHARAYQCDLVLGARPHHLGAADGEDLVRWVQDRVGPRGTHVDDARTVGHLLDQERRTGGIARVYDSRTVDRSHHGQVLARHLRRAVGSDLHSCMRPTQADVGSRDR